MANGVYATFLQALAEGSVDLSSGTFKCALVDSAVYTPDLTDSGDEFESDIASILTEDDLASPTWALRVFDAADFVGNFPDPGGGATGEYLIIYKDTGTPATSRLLFFFDTLTGLPLTLDGVADSITWNASGIWKLGA